MIVTAIDFETANRHPASVCALGAAVLEYGSIEEKISTLICPEKNVGWFSRQNIAVHGIYPEDVKDAPTFPEVYRTLKPYLENGLVAAHNARFDMACLKEACLNCGIPLPTFRYFDTVELARRVFPHLEQHRLNDVCEHLGFDLDDVFTYEEWYDCWLQNNLYWFPSGQIFELNPLREFLQKGEKPMAFMSGPEEFRRYQQETGMDKGSVFGEPQFVDEANRDYRLKPGSFGTNLATDGGPMGARFQ